MVPNHVRYQTALHPEDKLLNFEEKIGRRDRVRTCDTRFWRPMLYQLSYTPICKWWAIRDSNPGPSGYEPDALTN